MRFFKWLGIALIAVVVVFVFAGLVMSGDYEVSRSLDMKASTADVDALAGDLKNWEKWMPWWGAEDSMKVTLGEQTIGAGATMSWTAKEGDGKITITQASPETGLSYEMVLDGMETSTCGIDYKKTPLGTEVTWHMSGSMDGIIGSWMALIMNGILDRFYDEGLQSLKEQVEN